MSVIEQINDYMPTLLDKNDPVYQAMFGKIPFTPDATITTSGNYKCGAIANELEYSIGFGEYITRTKLIDDFYGEYLGRVVKFFTGLKQGYLETDEYYRTRFKALVQRQMNTSWSTTWMIRDVFSYFLNPNIIYVTENYVLDEFLVDGSFEVDPTTNWPVVEAGLSTVNFINTDMFYGATCAEFAVDATGSNCSMSQVLSGIVQGQYMLSFFTKDDRALPTSNLFKVTLRRSGDNYYYNFDTFAWQAGATYKTIQKNTGTRYESQQAFVNVPVGADLTLSFENIGGTTTPYKFYIDKVQFGTMLTYPTVKLVFVDDGSGVEFMSAWPGTTDPIGGGEDYTRASYFEQCYMSGFGGEGILSYYQSLFDIIKPAGVKTMIEVVWRAHV